LNSVLAQPLPMSHNDAMVNRLGQLVACLLVVALLAGCTFTIRPARGPEFTDVQAGSLNVSVAIPPKHTPPMLIVDTSRPNPVADSLETITIADILVGVETRNIWGETTITPVPLTQGDETQPLLIEEGSNTLTARLTGALPADMDPNAVTAVWITYEGATEACLLIPH
jgi:hypothetical protein